MMNTYACTYDLLPSCGIAQRLGQIDIGLTQAARTGYAKAIDLSMVQRAVAPKLGYIAGIGDGIVTVAGRADAREVLLMDANAQDYKFIARIWSLQSGHYMFTDLEPDKQYLVMARDYQKQYEPFAFDYVTPATDLTPDEQQELRQSWQIP